MTTVVVVRKGVNGSERFVAEDDALLRPGDVLEVALVAGSEPGPQTAGETAAQTPVR